MQSTLSDLLLSVPVTYVATAMAAIMLGIIHLSKRPNLDAIPTVGSSSWLGSWWAGIGYKTNVADVIRKGYKKHNGAPFKVAMLYRWVVIIGRRALVEEAGNARDDQFSAIAASNDDFNLEFTTGFDVINSPHHFTVIRTQLTRHIGALCSEMRDEIITAFNEILDLKNNEWKSVPALSTIQQIVCRASNRPFVGLPLCRDPGFVALNIQHTFDLLTGGLSIRFFPRFLKPLAVRLMTNVPKNNRRGVRHLGPIIEERRRCMNEYGNDWTEKPNDLISWLMDEAGPDASVETLTTYVLATNTASIHTSANVFTIALYNLAANPQYVEPLREEVEAIVEEEGWSKTSLSKMRKVDSFLKESTRMEGTSLLGMTRKAMKDFMFSDGTLIPKGTRINAGLAALHYDDALYENAEVFDPFRFADMSKDDEEGAKHQFAAASPEFLPFGYGRHVCPGRFFAATELKIMLAHVVTTYDLKLEDATRPRCFHIGHMTRVNPAVKLMFRERARKEGPGR